MSDSDDWDTKVRRVVVWIATPVLILVTIVYAVYEYDECRRVHPAWYCVGR